MVWNPMRQAYDPDPAERLLIVEFLLARIAEDEQAARRAALVAPPPWETADRGWLGRLYRSGSDRPLFEVDQIVLSEPNPGDLLRFFEVNNPARVLAECEAKRAIIEKLGPPHFVTGGSSAAFHEVLRLLALPYVDHPDYRVEWRSDAVG